jgi:hypothetical protein
MPISFFKIFKTVLFILLLASSAIAQPDTLTFKSGEVVVGKIKLLDRSVLTVKTSYSDSDFKIDWDAVVDIRSNQYYLITLSDGRRFNGDINSIGKSNEVIMKDSQAEHRALIHEVVHLKPIDNSFWDRFSASIDVGLNLTKANNLTQFNSRATVGYLTKRWELNGSFNSVFSSQDSIPDTRRVDANAMLKIFLPQDWYVSISNDFLQNDEQKLLLRSNTKLGIGNYLVHNNAAYLSLFAGAAYNSETYIENANPDRMTGEAFAGFEFNMFDAGDISLLTSTIAYPNLTEQGRLRVDFKFDIKYNLPLDFYIKAGTTLNYDNQPVAGGAELDYVVQTGIGWEW